MRFRVPELCHRIEDVLVPRWRMYGLMFCSITLIVWDTDDAVLFGDEQWRPCFTSLAAAR